jgi:hypothetical protein
MGRNLRQNESVTSGLCLPSQGGVAERLWRECFSLWALKQLRDWPAGRDANNEEYNA